MIDFVVGLHFFLVGRVGRKGERRGGGKDCVKTGRSESVSESGTSSLCVKVSVLNVLIHTKSGK